MVGNDETGEASASAGLDGIPHIGPARQAALMAARITTRSELARASVEQIVASTGMPRATAEKVSAFVRQAVASETEADAAPVDAAPVEEAALKILAPDLPPTPAPEDGADQGTDAEAELEAAISQTSTALSDATHTPRPKLSRQFTRFAVLMEALSRRAESLKPRAIRRIVRRLQRVGNLLERYTNRKSEASDKAQQRLRLALREEREKIEALLAAAAPQTPRRRKRRSGDARKKR